MAASPAPAPPPSPSGAPLAFAGSSERDVALAKSFWNSVTLQPPLESRLDPRRGSVCSCLRRSSEATATAGTRGGGPAGRGGAGRGGGRAAEPLPRAGGSEPGGLARGRQPRRRARPLPRPAFRVSRFAWLAERGGGGGLPGRAPSARPAGRCCAGAERAQRRRAAGQEWRAAQPPPEVPAASPPFPFRPVSPSPSKRPAARVCVPGQAELAATFFLFLGTAIPSAASSANDHREEDRPSETEKDGWKGQCLEKAKKREEIIALLKKQREERILKEMLSRPHKPKGKTQQSSRKEKEESSDLEDEESVKALP
ncbi:cilia- and flagella-associated protein HOATZ [Candoia aspera]|uniref:cilia- and flagella-associated protein HOATZ n=1 Tax=Candoia aspera TaxID=51853 RepID=UPI002FD83852